MNMYANLAKKCAVIASAMALCAAAVSGNAADTFAAGKDGVHPHVVGVVAHSDASDVTPRAAADYQGIWQNAPAGSEPGWGIAFAPRGDSVYATWFTYDADGSPMWLALTAQDISGVLDSDYAPQTVFVGSLYRATMSADAAGHPSADLVAYGPAVATMRYAEDRREHARKCALRAYASHRLRHRARELRAVVLPPDGACGDRERVDASILDRRRAARHARRDVLLRLHAVADSGRRARRHVGTTAAARRRLARRGTRIPRVRARADMGSRGSGAHARRRRCGHSVHRDPQDQRCLVSRQPVRDAERRDAVRR